MTEQDAINAAHTLKYWCKFWQGTPAPARCRCCFRVIDADGLSMCALEVCDAAHWTLPEGGLDCEK